MWVAAVQLNSTPEVEDNVARARAFIQEAAGRGAQLVALPEHFAYLGPDEGLAAVAQPDRGPLVSGFRELAEELKIFLLLGSFPELAEPGTRPYNTSLLLGPEGQVLARYRKMHLFDVDLPGVPSYRESRFTQPGGEVVVAPLPGTPGTAGLSVCYDLRFPELFRAMMARGGGPLPAARGLHRQHRAGPLGDPGAGPGHREPGLRGGAGPVRPPRPGTAQLRPLPHRGPLGAGPGPGPGRGRGDLCPAGL